MTTVVVVVPVTTGSERWASNDLLIFAFFARKVPFMMPQSGAAILAVRVTLPASTLPHPGHLVATIVNFLRAFGRTVTAGQMPTTESCELRISIASEPPPRRLPLEIWNVPSGHGDGLDGVAESGAANTKTVTPAVKMRPSRHATVMRVLRAGSYFACEATVNRPRNECLRGSDNCCSNGGKLGP